MALACPKCSSENVEKITHAMRSGVTHSSSQHRTSGLGVGVSGAGVGLGIGTTRSITSGLQQTEVSKRLNEEFVGGPKSSTGPFILTLMERFYWLLAGLVIPFLAYRLSLFLSGGNASGIVLLVSLGVLGVGVIAGLFCIGASLFASRDTQENRDRVRAMEAFNATAAQTYDALKEKGFYCHTCGHRFVSNSYKN